MSLLLLFNQSTGVPVGNLVYDSPITVPQWGASIAIDDLPQNTRVRAINPLEITYSLQNRGIMRAQTIDDNDDLAAAYRPTTGMRVVVTTQTGIVIFSGKILTTRETSMESGSGFGTQVDLDIVDDTEILEQTSVNRTFGTAPVQIHIVHPSNPAIIDTLTPHGLSTGQTVIISGVVESVPNVNGMRVVTVVSSTRFTIPMNVTSLGGSGTVRSMFHARDAISYIASLLEPRGLTLDSDTLQGPALEQTVLEGTAENALQTVCRRANWVYRVLPTGVLQAFPPGEKIASYVLDGDTIIGSPVIEQTREGYANTVEYTYGTNVVLPKEDPFVGNGVTRIFPLTYRPQTAGAGGSPGHVWVNGVANHVGVFGINDAQFAWLYRASDNTLIQNAVFGPPPANGLKFHMTYDVQFPQKVRVSDAARVTIDNGEIVRYVNDETIFEKTGALAASNSELADAITQPRRVTVVTREDLLFPGTAVPVDLPERHLDYAEWLVVTTTIREEESGHFRYTFSLIEDNQKKPGWIEYLKSIARGSGSGVSSTTITSVPPTSSGGGGGGGVSGSGTTDRIAKWTSNIGLGDSIMTEASNVVTVNGEIVATTRITSNIFRGQSAGGFDVRIQNNIGTDVARIAVGGVGMIFPNWITVNGGIWSDPGSHLTLLSGNATDASSDIVVRPGSRRVVPFTNYHTHLGKEDKKFLSLWVGELWVETLVAQETIATIGGRVLVGPTTTLVQDVGPADTVITVKHNNLKLWDSLHLESSGKLEVMMVNTPGTPVGSAGAWTYNVIRNRDGSGSNQWYAGDAVFNTGTPIDPAEGNLVASSFIDIYSIRSIKSTTERGPTIVGNVRTNYGAFAYSPRWAIGNLNGLYDYVTDTYGAAFGNPAGSWIKIDETKIVGGFGPGLSGWQFWLEGSNAWFKGIIQVVGTAGSNVALNTLANVTTIDGGKITTNSLHANRIITGTITADKLNVTSLSAISANLGTVTIGSSGHLSSSGTSWSSGTGFFLGRDGSSYKFRVGSTGGNRLLWDGSELEVRAGGITIDNDGISAGSAHLSENGLFIDSGGDIGLGNAGRIYGIGLFGQIYIDADSECVITTDLILSGSAYQGSDRALRVTSSGVVYAA